MTNLKIPQIAILSNYLYSKDLLTDYITAPFKEDLEQQVRRNFLGGIDETSDSQIGW